MKLKGNKLQSWRWHNDPEYRKEMQKYYKKKYLRRKKMFKNKGLTSKGKVPIPKKILKQRRIQRLKVYMESVGGAKALARMNAKKNKKTWAKRTPEERKKQMEKASEAWLKRVRVRRTVRELLGENFLKSLKQ